MEYFFEAFGWIFLIIVFGAQIASIYSLTYYFGSQKNNISDNARVFHHLVTTFCFVSSFLALVNNFFNFYSFSISDSDLGLNIYFLVLMIIGLVLNLKSRGKI
jgi:hypothetical protein